MDQRGRAVQLGRGVVHVTDELDELAQSPARDQVLAGLQVSVLPEHRRAHDAELGSGPLTVDLLKGLDGLQLPLGRGDPAEHEEGGWVRCRPGTDLLGRQQLLVGEPRVGHDIRAARGPARGVGVGDERRGAAGEEAHQSTEIPAEVLIGQPVVDEPDQRRSERGAGDGAEEVALEGPGLDDVGAEPANGARDPDSLPHP